MSTIFIAVQCCQCSTMQVKQRKKSSNKWACVVCNQKQSVLKVFAQGFMAKDVRKFVQSFNMSRQFSEQQSVESVPPSEDVENQFQINQSKKRTDWSEYIDSENDGNHKVEKEEDSGNVFEAMFVTELPKALFKKPKLRNYSAGLDAKEGEKPFMPVFGKRDANKQITSLDNEPSGCGGAMVKGASKWSDCTKKTTDKEPMRCQAPTAIGASKWGHYITKDDDDNDDNFADKALWRKGQTTIKGASKYNTNITEEDGLELESGTDFTDHMGQWSHAAFETTLNDQIVEEDIHPDFK